MRLRAVGAPLHRNSQRCRSFGALVPVVALSLLASPALSQANPDQQAQEKIDQAINDQYLRTNFGQAEDTLLEGIQACSQKCQPGTVAKLWMYAGVVRGSGKNDQGAAREAFVAAFKLDPAVKLDEALATPDTRLTFESAREAIQAPAAAAAAEAGVSSAAPRGGLVCAPGAIAVQTRRPVPISCQAGPEIATMKLRFKEFGGDWRTVPMSKVGGDYQAEISCESTKVSGSLNYYVFAEDTAGDPIDTFGTKTAPIVIKLADKVTDDPPTFPGKPVSERCKSELEKEICPPDFPGCKDAEVGAARGSKDWGAKCDNSAECRRGLLCIEGTCETSPACDADSDCPSGICINGTCDLPAGSAASGGGPDKRHWLGIHFAYDVGLIGGDNVCVIGPEFGTGEFECFVEGTSDPYPGPTFDGAPGDAYPGTGIRNGFAPGTARLLLSYDFAFSNHITAGLRAGYAFFGGPASRSGKNFLPVHAEVRGTYWFTDLSAAKFRPYVHLGGGLAQVDVKTSVTVRDCSGQQDFESFEDCRLAQGAFDSANNPDLPTVAVDAYRRLGLSFVTVGGGLVYAVGSSSGIQLNLNAMYMLGTTGFVVEPSLGFVQGL